MDLEPEQVEEERHNDQSDGTGNKVLRKVFHGKPFAIIKEIPQIDGDGSSNGHKGEDTNVFRRDGARQCKAGQEEPFPPFTRERGVTKLRKADVAEERTGHRKDQGRIKKNQAGLADVGII